MIEMDRSVSFDGSSKLKAALLMERWVKEEKERWRKRTRRRPA